MNTIFFLIIFFSTFSFLNSTISVEPKIVYVDVERIINESIAGKDLIKKFDNIQKKNSKKFEKRKIELTTLEKDIVQKKNILSKPDLDKKIKELNDKVKIYKDEVGKSQANFNKIRNDSTTKLVTNINEVLANYATKNSITMILQKNSIIIGKTEFDITKQILETINKKIKSISIN